MPEGVTLEISGVLLHNLAWFNFSWCYYGLDYRRRQGKFVTRRLCLVVGGCASKVFSSIVLEFLRYSLKIAFLLFGEVSERLIEQSWKGCVGFPYRGFESRPLR